jgi:CheY-like chemotaxis protein
VILADIRMPDVDGRALYREIERRWPDRVGCIVFITGDTLGSDLRGFAAETGRPVIEKPFLPGDVRRVVMEVGFSGDHPAAR